MSDERNEGIIRKYFVKRLNDPDGKHDDCFYFVLDPRHDPIARVALRSYAVQAALQGYSVLAFRLMEALDQEDTP